MSAHLPSPTRTEGRAATTLPWWGLVLPVLAFAVLLTLIADPAEAGAATGESPAAGILLQIQLLFTR
jgi:hypothetical protein